MPEWYQDDPKYYGKAQVNGKVIRLRETPESIAFLDRLTEMDDAEELLGSFVWLAQKAMALMEWPDALDTPPVSMPVGERVVEPKAIPEGERFIASLSDITDRERLTAIGLFLKELSLQLLAIAADHDPSIVPEEYRSEQ